MGLFVRRILGVTNSKVVSARVIKLSYSITQLEVQKIIGYNLR